MSFSPFSCSRDERRWIEKQNRASRAQRKKEEMNRIRTLVGTELTRYKMKYKVKPQLNKGFAISLQILHTAVTLE